MERIKQPAEIEQDGRSVRIRREDPREFRRVPRVGDASRLSGKFAAIPMS